MPVVRPIQHADINDRQHRTVVLLYPYHIHSPRILKKMADRIGSIMIYGLGGGGGGGGPRIIPPTVFSRPGNIDRPALAANIAIIIHYSINYI